MSQPSTQSLRDVWILAERVLARYNDPQNIHDTEELAKSILALLPALESAPPQPRESELGNLKTAREVTEQIERLISPEYPDREGVAELIDAHTSQAVAQARVKLFNEVGVLLAECEIEDGQLYRTVFAKLSALRERDIAAIAKERQKE